MNKDMTYCSNDKCEVKTKCKRSLYNHATENHFLVEEHISVFDGQHCENPHNVEDKYLYFIKVTKHE